jgi:hypothetical protein
VSRCVIIRVDRGINAKLQVMQSLVAIARRSFANVVMALGVTVFSGSVLFSFGILMEGVTHRVGEGSIAPPEPVEKSRNRLMTVGVLVGTAVFGWLLGRLGDTWRKPREQRTPHRFLRFIAEPFLLLGGFGLAIGFLIWNGQRMAAYQEGFDYGQVGTGAAICGSVLFSIGLVLYRLGREKAQSHA